MEGLHDIVVIFAAALAVIVGGVRLKVPPLIGFMITGMIVGPSGLAWVDDASRVESFAELGVVFLLFIIGLEFSSEKFRLLRKPLFLGGGVQFTITTVWTASLVVLSGLGLRESVFYGLITAMSSTAIVLSLYSQNREMESPHAFAATGILLFQDLMIVPCMLSIPLLAGTGTLTASQAGFRFAGGLVVIGAVSWAARSILPALFKALIHSRVRELMVIGALFACLGAGVLTESLGFSMALGSFLCGILLSETEIKHQILAETAPFRDVFTCLFFISIGMLLDWGSALSQSGVVAVIVVGILLIKVVATLVAVLAVSYPLKTALSAALALAQIGEFSFVLITLGHAQGLIGGLEYQTAIAASVVSMLLTPVWMGLAPRLTSLMGAAPWKRSATDEGMKNHVVIAGYGLNGQHLCRVLKSAGVPYVVVELDGTLVRRAREAGEHVVFGDATRRDILEACHLEKAQIAVFVVSDTAALRQGVQMARRLNPDLFIVARTRKLAEIEGLRRCGASEVIAEEFETSIETVTMVLSRLHIPSNIIRAQSRLLRADGYQMLREPTKAQTLSDRVLQVLTSGTTDTFMVSAEHLTAGNNLKDLALRTKSGATVIAVVRGEKSYTNPAAEFLLEPGDVLVIVGSHAQIEAAFQQIGRA
ncbi:MAG: cation:proton antiporter, partial [Planctomycetota bacterium]